MPRSSRHKSSKHSSREARDYSDSDEESGSRERRGAGEDAAAARPSKDSTFREKRSRESKDVYGSGNGEYADEHGGPVKRRKEKFADGGSDRWNGGDDDGSSKAKSSSDSKSRRREEEGEDARRSGKSERHRESSRKQSRESDRKDRIGKAEKTDEKLEISTDSRAVEAPENDNILERRSRKRRESFDDGGKYQYDIEDSKDRCTYSGDDATRGGKQKDEKLRDERHRDKHRDEVDKDSKNRYEKLKDDYPARDRNGSRSSEKYSRDEMDTVETRSKRSRPHDNDRDVEPSRERDRYRDRERDRDRDRDNDRDRDHELDRDRDGDHDRNRDRDSQDYERDRASAHGKERNRDLERGREREHDRDRDRDYEDRSSNYKDLRGKRRSPENHDDHHDSKSRDVKARSSVEKRSLSSTRGDVDDRGRSQSRQVHLDNVLGGGRSRTSPVSSPQGGKDEYRLEKEDDSKYRDYSKENRSRAISPRESAGVSGHADRGLKNTPFDKHRKLDDGHLVEFSTERPSASKESPRVIERSPSSTSVDRSRHLSRPVVRRNLDSEETGKRSDERDFPVGEGRLSREMSIGRPAVDDYSQADASFNSKSGPSNSSFLIPPQPPRRSDANLGRGLGNNWRGVPNWSPSLPNGFIPFQHGPSHGNFPAMMPHFPAPHLFGVRPPIDINQSGYPYHIADADRFPGHLRPIGWQNMIDASGFSRFNGWDGSGGLLRDEHPLFQGPDWDQNRHFMNIRGWEANSDPWKGQNSDLSVELPSASRKEDHHSPVFPDDSDRKDNKFIGSNTPYSRVQNKSSGEQEEVLSLEREVKSALKMKSDKEVDSSKSREENSLAQLSSAYLCKLDISAELADPELYKQCLNLVASGRASTGDGSSSMHMVPENHANAVEMISDGSLRVSLIPVIDDHVFQKAVDHYKKQRLEPWSSIPVVNFEFLSVYSSTDGDKDKQDHVPPEEKKDEQMPDISVSVEEMKVETPMASEVEHEQSTEVCPVISSDKERPLLPGEEVLPSTDTPCQNEPGGPIDCAVGDVEAISEARAASGNVTLCRPIVDDRTCDEGRDDDSLEPIESNMANLSRIPLSPESTH